jgi:hypothetical protein
MEKMNATTTARKVAPSVTRNIGIFSRSTSIYAPPSGDKRNYFLKSFVGKLSKALTYSETEKQPANRRN